MESVPFTEYSDSDDEPLTDEAQESVLTEGDSILAHYRIVSLIGRGGMGTLYRARDERLNRDVALKFLPSDLSAERRARDRLLMEARAIALLNHPNVCGIHEIAETPDGQMFLAMPLYDGITLKEKLRQGRLSIEESVTTAIQIARGLAAAHARGIVHRDVKPGNVMVSPDGTVRLLDFGDEAHGLVSARRSQPDAVRRLRSGQIPLQVVVHRCGRLGRSLPARRQERQTKSR